MINSEIEEFNKTLSKIKLVYNPKNIVITHQPKNTFHYSPKDPTEEAKLNNLSESELHSLAIMLSGLITLNKWNSKGCFTEREKNSTLSDCDLLSANSWNTTTDPIILKKQLIQENIYGMDESINSKLEYHTYFIKGDDYDVQLYKYKNDIILYRHTNDEIGAFIFYNEIKDPINQSVKGIWIDLLATKTEHQGKGIMKRLINELKKKTYLWH